MRFPTALAFAVCLVAPAWTFAQTGGPIRMDEQFVPQCNFRVNCRVQIQGKLEGKDESGTTLAFAVDGQSQIEYDERILSVNAGVVDKTLRLFSKMDFQRKVGQREDRATLRPEVSRIVILRQNNIEVPFSPDGPLRLLGEVDLIRTDVFTPALAGLLPKTPVKIGESWKADEIATRELTDLDKINAGELTCTLQKIEDGLAKVAFEGTIAGINEDGPTQHQLRGSYRFDLVGKYLRYIEIQGTQDLLDKASKSSGKVSGTFTLTREKKDAPPAIRDLTGAVLEPNEDNTRLLFEDAGIRLNHLRKWKPSVDRGQVRLADGRGNGLVITPDTASRLPTLNKMLSESRAGIERAKGVVGAIGSNQTVQRLPTLVESVAMDAELATERGPQRAVVVVSVVRDGVDGATVAGHIVTSDRTEVAREMERITRSVRVSRVGEK